MLCLTTAILCLLLLHSKVATAQNCVLRDGINLYDLSPLTVTSGGAYEVDGTGGDGHYFFNICGEVNQGACNPHQAVCNIGDAPHGCGDARDLTITKMSAQKGEGVELKYKSGETCWIMGNYGRVVTINLYCDPNVTTLRATEAREDPKCVYEIDAYSMHACPKEVPLTDYDEGSIPVNIFLVVHSHDDVGWLDTMLGYYDRQVESIINNIIGALEKNEERKFIQVEQAFFVKWWNEASSTDRNRVRKLVSNGQLKFPIGGWVMPDEATPSYSSLITQLTEGHLFLKQTFNVTPDVGWQIDPFGASHALAEIYKMSNFKGHVIDRIDWRVKNALMADKALQFQWMVSNHTEPLLTHVLDTLYCLPYNKGMKYSHELSPEEVVSSAMFAVDTARDKARWTRTPNVLIPVGCDFAYAETSAASLEYNALDKIIAYVRENKERLNVTGIQYSTIDDYFDALHASTNVTFPEYNGDFFPFMDKAHSWWTGYFTSRPALKGLIRKSESILKSSESLFSTVNMVAQFNEKGTREAIDNLVQAVSVNLHHDAITGTAKPHVVSDYTTMLNTGLDKNYEAIEQMMGLLTTSSTGTLSLDNSPNISSFLPVVVYNSLPWDRHDYVQLTIPDYDDSLAYIVECDDSPVPSQIMTKYSGSSETVLFFKVVLPPMGFQTYFIRTAENPNVDFIEIESSIKNDYLQIHFGEDNSIIRVEAKKASIDFAQKFIVYKSYEGTEREAQQSGAYIFRTAEGSTPFVLEQSSTTEWSLGDFVSDVYQEFSYSESNGKPVVLQHARIFHDEDETMGNFIEFSHIVGPVPHAGHGRELAAQFSTSINNSKTCFTDSNGLRFLEREYDPDMFLPLPGNHYPTVYASYFTEPESNSAIGFVWDRAHGISCSYGEAQVMLHRRTTYDDARGLSVPMDDDAVIDPVMRVVFGHPDEILELIYRQMYLLNFRPIVTVGSAANEEEWIASHITQFSLLASELPPNIHLVDLKSIESSSANGFQFILRLTHLFDYGEHVSLSNEVNLDMSEFFVEPYCISSLVETHLTANQVKEIIHVNQQEPPVITMLPKQMRTFLVDVEEDTDNCINHQCGENGKCIDLKCAYTCECGGGTVFDPLSKTCVYELPEENLPISPEISDDTSKPGDSLSDDPTTTIDPSSSSDYSAYEDSSAGAPNSKPDPTKTDNSLPDTSKTDSSTNTSKTDTSTTGNSKRPNDDVFSDDMDLLGAIMYLSPDLPLVIFAYLSFVCAFSIRREVTKLSSAPSSSSNSGRGRMAVPQKERGLATRFLEINSRMIEEMFVPIVDYFSGRI